MGDLWNRHVQALRSRIRIRRELFHQSMRLFIAHSPAARVFGCMCPTLTGFDVVLQDLFAIVIEPVQLDGTRPVVHHRQFDRQSGLRTMGIVLHGSIAICHNLDLAFPAAARSRATVSALGWVTFAPVDGILGGMSFKRRCVA